MHYNGERNAFPLFSLIHWSLGGQQPLLITSVLGAIKEGYKEGF